MNLNRCLCNYGRKECKQMYIVVLHKHSFTQYQYNAKSISFSSGTYTIVDENNNSHTYAQENYLVAIMA